MPHSYTVAGIFFIGVAKGCASWATPEGKQPAAAASGVHKLTIVSAPKGAEATPTKIAGRVGAAALGATAFILTSFDNGGGNKMEILSLKRLESFMKYAKFLFVIFLMSCINTKSIQYETSSRPPKPKDYPIEIVDTTTINRAYKVVGFVQADAPKSKDVNKVIEKLKEKARALGGDALIELQHQPVGAGKSAGYVRDLWTAKVIVWQT